MSARSRRVRLPPRAALAAGALAVAAGLVGLAPATGGTPDSHALLAWLALVAPAAGFGCGARGLPLWPWGLAVPGGWMLALAVAESRAPRELAGPLWAALAFAGLFALGASLGALFPRRVWEGVGALLLAGALLTGLAPRAGLTATTWSERSPAAGAFLFDLSPVTLVLESAGVDWERKPAVYAAAGTDWFAGRRAYRGFLAGPVLLVVGCLAYTAARASVRVARARGASAGAGDAGLGRAAAPRGRAADGTGAHPE